MKTKVLFLVLLMIGAFGFVGPVEAEEEVQERCECYCTSAAGATSFGKKTIGECSTFCFEKEQKVVVCTNLPEELPSHQPRCFTQEQCTKESKDGRPFGKWDNKYQPPECPNNMRYCYAVPNPEDKVKLNVAIGPLETTQDIGEYISAIYTWLMRGAITIAIVMVMIGGLQYVLSAGSGKIEQAKERIKNAVVGFVLLLSAVLILYTVNPNLTKLEVPSLPLVKTIEFLLDPSCEDLKKKGYTLGEASANKVGLKRWCGSEAKIEKDDNGVEVP